MADYVLTPKTKKKTQKTIDIGKELKNNFMSIGEIMKKLKKEAMTGYSPNLKKQK